MATIYEEASKDFYESEKGEPTLLEILFKRFDTDLTDLEEALDVLVSRFKPFLQEPRPIADNVTTAVPMFNTPFARDFVNCLESLECLVSRVDDLIARAKL